MPVYLHALGTVVPETAYSQSRALEVMRSWIGGDRRTDLLLSRAYARSGISTRHSVVDDFVPTSQQEGDPEARDGFYLDGEGRFRSPGTAERNARYQREAGHMFPNAAARALARAGDLEASDVTHLVTASCTGFYAPGPDLDVVRALGLSPGTERYHLGFMGCYAAFPALRMAQAFCRNDPRAVVLVVAVEACSLHLQATSDPDAVISASLFGDGGAAAVVSARPPRGPGFELIRFADGLAPEGHSDMAWTLGDHGFEMALSRAVPRIVAEKADVALDPLLGDGEPAREEVPRWAVHPGGRGILDRLQDVLALPPEALAASRAILDRFGNMSSATVLFVLAELLREPRPRGEPVVALAFGPGLSVTSALLRRT